MPREIALGDALVPGLLLVFVVALLLLWLLDWRGRALRPVPLRVASAAVPPCGLRLCLRRAWR